MPIHSNRNFAIGDKFVDKIELNPEWSMLFMKTRSVGIKYPADIYRIVDMGMKIEITETGINPCHRFVTGIFGKSFRIMPKNTLVAVWQADLLHGIAVGQSCSTVNKQP